MSKKKGDILESIVAELHRVPGVRLTRNARLRAPSGGKSGRGRDIDVLLEADVAGYEIQIAIECKNESKPIGAPKIDGFVGKLGEIGIPTKHGIFVSTSGFTAGALQSAKAHRIRPLVLTGLALDGIRNEVGKALCSTVYLLPTVLSYDVKNNLPASSFEFNFLYADGEPPVFLLDEFAKLWTQEQMPSTLGKHAVELPIKPSAYQIIDGNRVEVLRVNAEIEVIGLVLQMDARTVQHALMDPLTQSVQKIRTIVEPRTQEEHVPLSLVAAHNEEDLQQLCTPPDLTSVVERFRLPRIRYGPAYWPLSSRARKRMKQAVESFLKGEGPNPSELTLKDIEGNDLAEIFEF